MKRKIYRFFMMLTRRANNGELFNRKSSRDSKDNLTVFFWRIAQRFE